ncbi:MAG: SDR family NAD(P)-dependent oxidoreductase [Leptospiraceae bacterium]|nr:SDR family NAD(P)-dependent oxidoreductase [Leptospiraceae bacterium]MCB1201921.1 SDR family NAD(P)-dependent oxidoreductase [Leptospiraceae bacterium]
MSYQKKEVKTIYFNEFKATLPSMQGKTVVITGTTSGTGNVAAHTVAHLGAKVILLNRKSERSEKAYQEIKSAFPKAEIVNIECDLQSFASVREAAKAVIRTCPEGVNVLTNNAGVMALKDEATKDGFDVQMQTNHLSHFLLTKELFSSLTKAADSAGEARIVNHSSIARMNPKKILLTKYLEKRGGNLGGDSASMLFGGARWLRYNQTKLANCAFTAALHHKLQNAGSKIKALVAHPGLSNTGLQVTTVKDGGMGGFFTDLFMGFGQSPEDGTMGLLSCMCKSDAQSGEFYGPGKGVMAMKGKAIAFGLEPFYDNEETRSMLWQKSCEAIGEDFNI